MQATAHDTIPWTTPEGVCFWYHLLSPDFKLQPPLICYEPKAINSRETLTGSNWAAWKCCTWDPSCCQMGSNQNQIKRNHEGHSTSHDEQARRFHPVHGQIPLDVSRRHNCENSRRKTFFSQRQGTGNTFW